jgi:hypothetical protein
LLDLKSYLTQNFQIGSPTTFADDKIRKKIFTKASSNSQGHGLYVPSGAFWGAEDVKKMADRGTLKVSLGFKLLDVVNVCDWSIMFSAILRHRV